MRIPGRTAVVATAVLLASCSDDSPMTLPPTSNGAPTVMIHSTPEGPAVMGATVVRFVAEGTDPDGDTLTYSWSFGDGTTSGAVGSPVDHVFEKAGTFDVSVTAADGEGHTGVAATPVTVRSLTGFWTSLSRAWNYEIHHEGTQLSGRLLGYQHFNFPPGVPALEITGTVDANGLVQWTVPAFFIDFEGTLDPSLNRIEGTLYDCTVSCRHWGEVVYRD